MATMVVNVHHTSQFQVYVGRGSRWGNPFRIGDHGTRLEVLKKYEEYIRSKPELMNSLHELKDKVLGCSCDPQPCHAHILARLADTEYVVCPKFQSMINDVSAKLDYKSVDQSEDSEYTRIIDKLKTNPDINKDLIKLNEELRLCMSHCKTQICRDDLLGRLSSMSCCSCEIMNSCDYSFDWYNVDNDCLTLKDK